MNLMKSATAVLALTMGASFTAEAFAADLTWNVSLWGKRRAFTEHIEKLASEVATRTDGRFEIKLHYGGALSKSRENLDGIAIGAFEMAQFCASYHADKNPTLTVTELPFLGVPDLETQIKVDLALYQHPAVQKDLARWNAKPLMSSPMPQYNILGAGDAPQTVADFEGMRVRALGGIGSAMEIVGAVPTSVTAAEAYQALDSGTVRAVSFAPHAHLSFNTIEAGNWWTTNLNPGTVHCPVVVNMDAYDMLPDDFKQALNESIQPALDHYVATYAAVYEKFYPALEENGVAQISFSQEELASFKEKAGQPVWDAWLADMESKGVPGDELLKLVQDTMSQ
ncbi:MULTISPECIES: C4-dicarboxylate TRAP transporter substrate-binding protein [Pseudovibrio]|uniref:C4-dicarboxylate TRAP transporter substrate-binding protein n=1 Tax=Stappiaceae TaxID=2821832 RepID=UPI00236732DD|nr:MULTISPECIES: C4-dicarboxylate TRAP transporter substrate-binding protein [Pseudovibrio]MDD7911395.1 C4-dicarboxylate TRAP transporter substrate-binding protein [Pseudovibrio exalbescens]MDX5592918.1 C4-dicarboxylate TRAP transporter substrate-binding protein [Pseudovibrio sp. SPO723]